MDESAKKRKRNEDDGASEDSPSEGEAGGEIPKEGLKRGDGAKKPRPDEESKKSQDTASKSAEEAESRKKLKEEKKEKKKAAQKEKKKAKESAKKEKQPDTKPANTATKEEEPSSKEEDSDDGNDDEDAAEGLSLMFNPEQPEQPSTASSTPNSPSFDVSNTHSGSSSISSIVPPTANESVKQDESSSEPKPLKPTPEELKQRLQKRLDELRAARHADGLNGRPARNRQELIEARRQKAEQRKTHKKMLRQKAKEEEQQKNDEAMARRFSPSSSGSLLASPRSPADSTSSNNNASYSFGRVVFADGQHTDPTLSNTRDKPKQSGAKDPASALQAVESKKARLAGLDETKRADIEEKDLWLNAKKRAHGERVRDDTSLLKKALKRKESAKRKSEREWKERADTVKKGKEMKQTKREDNLRKRREEKGSNKGKKATGGGSGGKKKARPGFEGSFKTKVGGKKK